MFVICDWWISIRFVCFCVSRFVACDCNRQYSYSPTVLGRVGLDHECEAHAGNFSPRGQTNMRKLAKTAAQFAGFKENF